MAKKILYSRVIASRAFWPAVFEDISDDEDTCDIQPIDYSTSPRSKIPARIESVERELKKIEFDNVNTVIKEEPVEEEDDVNNEKEEEVNSDVETTDEKLLMEWNEEVPKDVHNESHDDKTFAALLSTATFVMDCNVPDDAVAVSMESQGSGVSSKKSLKSPRKSPKSREKSVQQQFDCHLCSRKYWKRSKLEAHLRTKHDKREAGGRSVEDRRNLVSKCPDCKVQLENKTQMYVHRLTHLIPAFSLMSCPLCSKNQYSFTNLKTHMKTAHKVESSWFCPICPGPRTFTQNHSLLAHISTFHFDSSRTAPAHYLCHRCQSSFTSKALLGKHLQNDHGGLIETSRKTKLIACYVCQKKMEDLTQLRRHLINHNEHKFGRQSPKIKKEEFTAKFLEFSKKHFKAPKPSFSISSILSEA